MKKTTFRSVEDRVWEIDAVRGLLIAGVLLFHLYFTIDAFFVKGCYTKIDAHAFVKSVDPLGFLWKEIGGGDIERAFLGRYFNTVNLGGVSAFFVISGISSKFSRSCLHSGIRLLWGALFVSGFTKLLVFYTGDSSQFIRFGVLHCYACCHLIYYFFLEEREDKTLLWAAGLSLLIGYYLRWFPVSSDFALLVPFGVWENGVPMRDYWPVFPMFGWFLLGAVLGKRWYGEKVSRWPKSRVKRMTGIFQYLGRHSGIIYCGHMVVYTVLFGGAGYIFDLF